MCKFVVRRRVVIRSLFGIACGAGLVILGSARTALAVEGIRIIDLAAGQVGGAAAAVVDDLPLVHTTQLLPAPAVGGGPATVSARTVSAQVEDVVGQLARVLAGFDSGLDRVVRLHVCVPDDAAAAETIERLLAAFPAGHRPPCSCVSGPLPDPASLVAIDAVAVSMRPQVEGVVGDGKGRILPTGSRIYVSGQAASAATLAAATRGTLVDLEETLASLGRTRADVVQYKAFLTPMADAAVVRREVARFHEGGAEVPLVMVEWRSAGDKPIEIEAVAWGGPDRGPARLEYLTPPGKTASPIFSRVARLTSSRQLYIAGLRAAADPGAAVTGEPEVTDVFAALERVLRAGGSDMRHLVKATYCVSADDSSVALNALRPRYYDPARPPAASKAAVAGVGQSGRGLLIDMIAVPTLDP